jgi:hypothetical protein
MKFIPKILSLILVVATIVGCSKSNDSKPIAPNPVVGKWNFPTDTTNYYQNGFDYLVTTNPPLPSCYIQFNSDGTGAEVSLGLTTPTGSIIAENLPFIYTIVNGKLTLTSSNQTYVGFNVAGSTVSATIKTLNSSDLSLYFDTTKVSNGATYEIKEAAHFKKM